jgi:pimeloyl-ACP methyl ester carboxylesterase
MTTRSHFVEIDSIRLHYLQWGPDGHRIVLLHGNSHCGGVWAPLAERLSDSGFSVIAPDLRGHGLSSKPGTGYGWGDLRQDIAGLLDALNIEDALIVGHSRGGGVGLLVAAALPERVQGVLVYEPTLPPQLFAQPRAAGIASSRTATMAERALNRRAVFAGRDEALAHFRGRGAFQHWQDEYLHAYVQHGTVDQPDGTVALACPPWVEARLYEATPHRDAWMNLACPDLPVLALYGERGGRAEPGRDPAADLRTMFPRCTAEIMADARHFGPMERPESFEQVLRAFADQVQGRGIRAGR